MSRAANKMTPRQARFVQEFLIVGVLKTAAVRAGYSAQSAEVIGSRLLATPHVAAAIKAGQAEQERRTGVTADRVLRELARVAFSDIAQVADWAGDRITLMPAHLISDDDRAAVASMSVTGKRVRKVRVRMHDKLRALDALARHFNLYGPISGKLGMRAPDGETGDARADVMARLARLAPKTD